MGISSAKSCYKSETSPNPKPESPKAERKPKSEKQDDLQLFGFGLRASFGFQRSGFGFEPFALALG
jgi:hypothetical protein